MSKQMHLEGKQSSVAIDEYHFSRLNDALEPYARAVQDCWSSCRCVRLYCTVPTCPSSNADLQDLKDLQSRCFGFIHALVKLLRTSGVYASYHLTFAPTSQVVVRAFDAQHACVQDHHCGDEKVALERTSACDPHTATVLVLHDTPVLVAN